MLAPPLPAIPANEAFFVQFMGVGAARIPGRRGLLRMRVRDRLGAPVPQVASMRRRLRIGSQRWGMRTATRERAAGCDGGAVLRHR